MSKKLPEERIISVEEKAIIDRIRNARTILIMGHNLPEKELQKAKEDLRTAKEELRKIKYKQIISNQSSFEESITTDTGKKER